MTLLREFLLNKGLKGKDVQKAEQLLMGETAYSQRIQSRLFNKSQVTSLDELVSQANKYLLHSYYKEVQKAYIYCSECFKFNGGACIALDELYPLWNTGQCWAREINKSKWKRSLESLKRYALTRGNSDNADELFRFIEKQSKVIDKVNTGHIREVMKEDIHRGRRGGGGEQSEGQSKDRMKDNKLKQRWDGTFYISR